MAKPQGQHTGSVVYDQSIAIVMRHIDRREWWLWSSALSVTVGLALGVASFTLPALLSSIDDVSALPLDHASRGLLGLVLLFNIYTIYEQVQIRAIRRELTKRLYGQATADPVTGLFNRRYVEIRLETEIARSQRYGTSLTIFLLDLDAFKQVNDRYGHLAGDNALRTFAEQLKKVTRGSDVVARYGGDEFLALLPDCRPDGVQRILERLRAAALVETTSQLPIRFSVGWTNYIKGEPMEELLKRADAALYANKRLRTKQDADAVSVDPVESKTPLRLTRTLQTSAKS